MSDVFRKLNLKDQREIVVLNAPASFEPELQTLKDVTISRSVDGPQAISFSLAFVITQSEVDRLATAVAAKASGDSIVWFAYPKGSSRNYQSEINRDSGWKVLGECGFEPVRMVAIDADWSAVRFRRAEFIKTMTRGVEWAGSAVGREKAAASARVRQKAPARKASAKKASAKKASAKKASAKKPVAKKASARKASQKPSRSKRRR
jgi:hypothetical protein